MSVRKVGRKARALERAKWVERVQQANRPKAETESWYDDSLDQRIDAVCQGARKRKEKREKFAEALIAHPEASTRSLARLVKVHRHTANEIREQLGFVVPKKDYKCYKPKYNFPPQSGEVRGMCACGCGGKTNQAKHNNQYMRAGEFYRFISGHQWLIHRNQKPKGWRSSTEIMRDREHLRERLVLTAAKLPRYTKNKVATFEDLRNRLKKIELQGRNVVDQQVSRMINVGRFLPLDVKIPNFIHANEVTKTEWLERLVSTSLSIGKSTVEFSELKRRFNEPMLVPNHALSRLLNHKRETENESIPFIEFTSEKRVIVEPISEFYPYGGQDDLLQFILGILPQPCVGEMRGDLAQDMALAVLSGTCQRENLQANLPAFMKQWHKRFSVSRTHKMISFDAPVSTGNGGGAINLHELIGAEQVMTEFQGGMNYETQSEYYERSEQWDGEIVGRY